MNVLALQILGVIGAITAIATALYFLCKLLIARYRKNKELERSIIASLESIENTIEDIE